MGSGVVENIYDKERRKIGVPSLPSLSVEQEEGEEEEDEDANDSGDNKHESNVDDELKNKLFEGFLGTEMKQNGPKERNERKDRNVKEDWMPMMLRKPRPSEKAANLEKGRSEDVQTRECQAEDDKTKATIAFVETEMAITDSKASN